MNKMTNLATIHNIKLTGSRHRSPHQQQKMTTSFSSVFSDYGGGGLDAANAENDELIVGPTKRQQQHVEIGAGGLLAEYSGVERVHRIKPKAPVKLLIREGCIELAPAKTDGGRGARTTKKWGPSRSSKNNDLATSNENNNSRGGEGEHHQSSKGTKRIPWDRVCAVELVKKSNPRRSALRLTTLQPTPPHPTRGDLIVYGDDSHHHPSAAVVDQLCADEGAVWKSIMLEAEADSIWRIVAELNQVYFFLFN
jgi:hypothetical protein